MPGGPQDRPFIHVETSWCRLRRRGDDTAPNHLVLDRVATTEANYCTGQRRFVDSGPCRACPWGRRCGGGWRRSPPPFWKPRRAELSSRRLERWFMFSEKNLHTLPPIDRLLNTRHIKSDILCPNLFKIGQIIPEWFWTVALYFSFSSISNESSKNQRKIIK